MGTVPRPALGVLAVERRRLLHPVRDKLDQLGEINWDWVAATDFRPSEVKEAKQAEFLVEQSFSWSLVERIGIHSPSMAARVATAMGGCTHRPRVEVQRGWYF